MLRGICDVMSVSHIYRIQRFTKVVFHVVILNKYFNDWQNRNPSYNVVKTLVRRITVPAGKIGFANRVLYMSCPVIFPYVANCLTRQ